jgi:putative tricarboxylic transport membrane protein
LRAPQGDNAMMMPSLTEPREDAMQPFRLMALLALVGLGVPGPALAQDFYAGKTLKIIVGLEAGGTVDTMARLFVSYLRRHIPGNPLVVIQNMPSAAGVGATNFVYEKAEPDGLTILFNSWDPLAQVLGDQGMRARYENFEYVGGVGDIRVIYGRTDMVPGGLKRPADIMKAENLILGSLNYTNQSGLLPHLALKVLGVKHRMIVGFRGGNGVFLAMQRGEFNIHSTSIATFRGRSGGFIKSGEGVGIAYLVPVDKEGRYARNALITEMPSFPDLFKEVHGRMPSGPTWDAFNWLTNQIGELTYIVVAPPRTPAAQVAALRQGFEGVARDPAFERELMARQGVPYSHVGTPQGQAIFRALAEVSPDVIRTLHDATKAPN